MNAEGKFIFTSIPLNSGIQDSGGTKVFPTVVDGRGSNSVVILVNAASTASIGAVQFSFDVASDRGVGRTFNFTVPPGGVWRIGTMGLPTTVTSGYASLVMSGGSPMPESVAISRRSARSMRWAKT